MVSSYYIRKLHFFIFLLVISLETIIFVVGNLDTDKEALMSFKSLVSEPSSLSTWGDQNTSSSSSPCNWTGVLCDNGGRRVIALDLTGLNLVGSISPQIGNLSSLISLQLAGNQLSGTLPYQLGSLVNLQVLNVSFNRIQGPIPPNISNCTELTVLDLTQNNISGNIPGEISLLSNLRVLDLARNKLFGPIPPSIGNLSSLTVLSLGTNVLNGTIPDDLSRLRNLKHFDLTINNLYGMIPPSVYNMSSLVSLAVASNNLWGLIPTNVGVTLPNLVIFNFCINKFTGTIPGSLHNLTRIQVIRMAHNQLHGTVPPGLGNLPELEMYNIGYNYIVNSGDSASGGLEFLTSFTNSTRLNFLAIDGNLLEGVIPQSIGNLSKGLSILYMGQNRIYGNIPSSIGQLRGLALLNLSYNSVSGDIPQEIGQLEQLKVLNLARNRISGTIPTSIGNLRELSEIDLSRNDLVGSVPTSFGNFPSLLLMDLSNNKLNGSIPRQVLNLPSLSTYLNLSNNSFTGLVPQEIASLQNVVTIDVSDNDLSGEIPDSIGNCKSLEGLSMSRNIFSGKIPTTLGQLKGLETLDLSFNKLHGSIPVELQDLQALRFLNLSFNNLEGIVPSKGVFENSSEVHLQGNPKLGFQKNGGNRKRSILLYVIIPVAVVTVLCFSVALFCYLRKGKTKVMTASESVKGQPQLVSYNELLQATAYFSQEHLIGQGSFGSVYKGHLNELGLDVAVKVIDIEKTGSWKSFVAECTALRSVRHRNLVKLITSCSSLDFKNTRFLALVYELMNNGSLEDWVSGTRMKRNGERLSLMDRLNVAIDVACGVEYLHYGCETPVVHCDLKPSNLLLDQDMTAKVGDFGLAKLLMNTNSDQQYSITSTNGLRGSIGYIPPEYGMGEKPSTAGDVYSYGIMLLELFTGKSPTDSSFTGGLSLKSWVETAFPDSLEQVIDPYLVKQMSSNPPCDDHGQSSCMETVIEVALYCTADSRDLRITMRDVLRKLIGVRDDLHLQSTPTPRKQVTSKGKKWLQ